MKQGLIVVACLVLIGCAGAPTPKAPAGRVSMPEGFRPVAAHDLTAEWLQPFRRLERGIRLLPKLHPEVDAARPQVFVHPGTDDVIVFAPLRLTARMTAEERRVFLRRALTEIYGPERPPELVYSRTRKGRSRQYAESASGDEFLTKLGCLAVSGEGTSAWLIGGFWRLGGTEPFRMDRYLIALADQVDGGSP